jgi:hypothetical protein
VRDAFGALSWRLDRETLWSVQPQAAPEVSSKS